MPTTRKAVPKRVEKQLFQECDSCCPLCGEDDVAKLQIHHIKPYAETGTHDPEQMLVLCANCHAEADVGAIPSATLYKAKRCRRIIKFPQAAVTQNVSGHGNVVAGGDVSIRVSGRSKRTAMPRPAGTVCDDPRKVGYLQYLAKRYNQFRAWACKQAGERMNYGFIHGVYDRHMKYAIRTTPLSAFEEGATFLQHRILRTKLGRMMNARGQRLFSSFDEFDGNGDLAMP